MSHDWHAAIDQRVYDIYLSGFDSDSDTQHWEVNPDYPFDREAGIDVTTLRNEYKYPFTVTEENGDMDPEKAKMAADILERQIPSVKDQDRRFYIMTVVDWLRYWADEGIDIKR